MPELPEVEVVKRSLEKYILNKNLLKIIVKNKKLRFPVPKNLSKKFIHQRFEEKQIRLFKSFFEYSLIFWIAYYFLF